MGMAVEEGLGALILAWRLFLRSFDFVVIIVIVVLFLFVFLGGVVVTVIDNIIWHH